MHKRYLLLFLFALLSQLASAEYVLSKGTVQAYSLLMKLNLIDARKEIEADRLIYPGNSFHPLLENYCDFLKLMLEEDEIFYKQKLAVRGGRIELLEAGNKSSPFYNFCLAEVHLQWAMVRLKFGDKLRAASDIKQAAACVERNKRQHPAFLLTNKPAGLIHAMAGTIPASYGWLANLAGIRGTVGQGLTELDILLNWLYKQSSYQFLIPEILFIQNFIQSNLAPELVSEIPEVKFRNFGDQPLLNYSAAVYYQKKRNAAKTIDWASRIPRQFNGVKFCYVRYIEAEAEQNLTLTAGNFSIFMACHAGTNYLKAAQRKKAWSMLLSGNVSGYQTEIKKVLLIGNAEVDDDKQAQLEAESGNIPDKQLLTARLRFDGGLYDEALAALLLFNRKHTDPVKLTEYYYRLGRCQDAAEKDSLALINYAAALEIGKNIHDYYAASACFYSGLIAEKRKDPKKAKMFFKRVATFPEHPYKNSLDAKAKAALVRLGN